MYQIFHIVRYVKLIPGSESLVSNRGHVAFLENEEEIIELQFDRTVLRLRLRLKQNELCTKSINRWRLSAVVLVNTDMNS